MTLLLGGGKRRTSIPYRWQTEIKGTLGGSGNRCSKTYGIRIQRKSLLDIGDQEKHHGNPPQLWVLTNQNRSIALKKLLGEMQNFTITGKLLVRFSFFLLFKMTKNRTILNGKRKDNIVDIFSGLNRIGKCKRGKSLWQLFVLYFLKKSQLCTVKKKGADL